MKIYLAILHKKSFSISHIILSIHPWINLSSTKTTLVCPSFSWDHWRPFPIWLLTTFQILIHTIPHIRPIYSSRTNSTHSFDSIIIIHISTIQSAQESRYLLVYFHFPILFKVQFKALLCHLAVAHTSSIKLLSKLHLSYSLLIIEPPQYTTCYQTNHSEF